MVPFQPRDTPEIVDEERMIMGDRTQSIDASPSCIVGTRPHDGAVLGLHFSNNRHYLLTIG
jgi:hypothetical protein